MEQIAIIDPSVIVSGFALIQAVAVAVIGGIFSHLSNKNESRRKAERDADMQYRKEREEREEARRERDAAMYGVVLSTAKGTEVLLHKAHGDKLNGNVEHSLLSIEKSISKYNKLANEEMAKLG